MGGTVVDIDGKFKYLVNQIIYSKFKNIYGSTLLELSYNSTDNSILKINDIDISTSVKTVTNDFYIRADIGFKLSCLTGASPAVLTTIVELANALDTDHNYAATRQNQINLKADKSDSYPKAEMNVAIGILQAGIDRKVGSNVVDIDGKFKYMLHQLIYNKIQELMEQHYLIH